MSEKIDPRIMLDDRQREAVFHAEKLLAESFRTSAEGRSWHWEASDEADVVRLVMEYSGNRKSRTFGVGEISSSRDWVWKVHDLWQDVLLANVRKTSNAIIEILREMQREEILQGA